MSEFAAEVRKIGRVWEHPNADALSLASVEDLDYQFVIGLDNYKAGDEVVYIPVDSLLPQPLVEFLGLTGRLSGKEKNRVKTVKLRQEISQGLVESVTRLQSGGFLPATIGSDVTAELGIEKYEPPPGAMKHGNGSSLPDMVEIYDIQSCQRYNRVVEDLMDHEVYITEKMEGTHISITKRRDSDTAIVSSRRHARDEGDYVAAAQAAGLQDIAEEARAALGAQQVTLRGEVIGPGVQGNIYRLKDRKVLLFDIKSDGHYIVPRVFYGLLRGHSALLAPLLHRGTLRAWLDGRTPAEASNGISKLADVLREGVVIRSASERVILKQRSPEYLAKEK